MTLHSADEVPLRFMMFLNSFWFFYYSTGSGFIRHSARLSVWSIMYYYRCHKVKSAGGGCNEGAREMDGGEKSLQENGWKLMHFLEDVIQGGYLGQGCVLGREDGRWGDV